MKTLNELSELLYSLCQPRLQDVPASGRVFSQGDSAGEIFLVLDGVVRLVRYTDQGTALTLFRAQAGQTFAEAALFSPIYHCTAVADRVSRVAGFAKKELLASLEAHPPLMLRLIAMLSRQVRDLRTLLEVRSIPAASDRVMQYLHLQANPGNGMYTVPSTWKDVAQELGLAHETLYRALASLEKQNRIRREGRSIVIADLNVKGHKP